jgi:hypothetical protein
MRDAAVYVHGIDYGPIGPRYVWITLQLTQNPNEDKEKTAGTKKDV